MEVQRIDGNKLQCSRDVTLDQKYCERHCHKSRPHLSKPVELQAQLNKDNDKNNDASKLYQKSHFLNQIDDHRFTSIHLLPKRWALPHYVNNPSRCLEGFMNGEMVSVAVSNKEYHWQQRMQTKVGLNKDDTTICDTSVAHSRGEATTFHPIHYYQFM